jgi:hypothetical protein
MDQKEPPPAFMSALTTEHFVLQTAMSAATNEVGTRASSACSPPSAWSTATSRASCF